MNALQKTESTEFHVFENKKTVEIPPCLKEFLINQIPNPVHKIKVLKAIFPEISLFEARNITRGWEN